jgi:peptide-methionine (S)-S-oxide reductase
MRTVLVALALVAVGMPAAAKSQPEAEAKATFAGGCYWCMEEPFEKLVGVISVTAGWAGGTRPNPTYEEIASGKSGYAESVEVVYDPAQIMYEKLLDVYWHNVDPLTPDGQFCDHGRQYRSAIFFHDEGQRRLAEESKRRVEDELHAKVVTEIAPATPFSRAPESQQDFYKKNPQKYQEYVKGCGRHRRLEQLWGNAAGHGKM